MFEPIREILFAGCMIGASVIANGQDMGRLAEIRLVVEPVVQQAFVVRVNDSGYRLVKSVDCDNLNRNVEITFSDKSYGDVGVEFISITTY